MKEVICLLIGCCGSAVATLFGGWSDGMTILLIFMAVDYISGLMVAGVFKKSTKTDSGALESRAGETAYTLTIGTTNLNKMTAEEKAIATNKNWNLA